MLFFGVFVAETVKNVAKGTADALQNNVNSYLQLEFVSLNLNADDILDETKNKLELKPEVTALICEKMEADELSSPGFEEEEGIPPLFSRPRNLHLTEQFN